MNETNLFLSAFKIKKKFDITSNTLKVWAQQNLIRFIRTNNGHGKRLYHLHDVEKMFGINQNSKSKKSISYTRVSSEHQKEDLNRQIELLKKLYPENDIISDIGSGLNFERKGFKTLLDKVYNGDISEVVVTYKDRLCRFGFELVEWIFKKHDVKLKILNSNTTDDKSSINELSEDLLSITTVFVARHNGIRSAQLKKQRKELQLKS